MGTIFPFFYSEGKASVRRACLKTTSNGIESPHIFNMRILLLSCQWALFEWRFWTIFQIASAQNVAVDKRLSVIKLTPAGRELLLGIGKHCLEKKKLKSSFFSLRIQ